MEKLKKNRILIVDDMQTNLELLRSYLHKEAYQIATVTSAKAALSKLKSHSFDLILLDIVMPEMDGIELCKILKNNNITKNIPVIFLTAVSSDKVIIEAFDAGGIDYIKKPFNPYELKRKIHNHLELINFRKETEKAREEAEFANKAKSIFLGNISHELRTPLNGIVATLELLHDTSLNEQQKEMVGIASESAANLTFALNDLLDLTKIESGLLEIMNEEFNPYDMVQNAIKIFNLKAEAKNLKFNLDFDPLIPDKLMGDKYRTQQVLTQLLDNSVKFTNEGTIDVSINLEEQNSKGFIVKYCVSDHGKGISPIQQKTIFDPFTQVENNSTRAIGGMGSGLALAKKIVELMNGKIEVYSELGEGSTFCFTIFHADVSNGNRSLNPGNKTQSDAERNYKNLRVLVVDDNIVNLKVAHMILNKLGLNVDMAENGVEALAKFTIRKPELILMDIQMPIMDGIETTQKIRKVESMENLKPIPIIALTASAMKGDKEMFLNTGMNDYISKPFKKDDLERILRKYCC